MKKLFGMLAGLALLITGGWGTAQAITLDLTVDHCTGGCGPGGGAVLAQVTLTDTAAGVDFSIMPSAGLSTIRASAPCAAAGPSGWKSKARLS